MGIIQAISNLD